MSTPPESVAASSPFRVWRSRLAAAVIVTGVGAALGLAVNGLRSNGLSLNYAALQKQGVFAPVDKLADEGQTVTREELIAAQSAGAAVVVDARPRSSYEAGHLPGAFSLPFDAFADAFLSFQSVFPTDMALIVYCTGGECTDSVHVRDQLLAAGYVSVKVYRGGWKDWTAAGEPMEKGADPLEGGA